MTEFTFQLLLVGIPGIIALFLVRHLTGARKTGEEVIVTVFNVLCFSVASYLLYAFFDSVSGLITKAEFHSDVFTRTLRDVTSAGAFDILAATGCAVVVAVFWTMVIQRDWLNKLARKYEIARTHGYEDVWDYFLNLPREKKHGGWVVVRDHKAGLVYYGHIIAWSEWGNDRELLISHPDVFQADGKKLATLEKVYLSRSRDDLTIEVPPAPTRNP